ncbi:MAG: NAD(+)/NADH kinase [Dehalococcoidales bacterium]|nr:NAD(+)/NADH kinase [Dehalococcoidales bacterium]
MFEKIGVIYHPMNEPAKKLTRKLEQLLSGKGFSVWTCSSWDGEAARSGMSGTDLVLSVGGDGTILRTAQAIIPGKTPVTGINLGKLGFMTELNVKEVEDKLTRILKGEGWIDERALLEARLFDGDGSRLFYALNDVVVARGAIARVVYIKTTIDDKPLTTYKGDGVIAATATGSTGYALAAGGPILHPQSRDFILLPILPHLSTKYCMVLPSSTKVKLDVQTVYPATISIDGHTNLQINSGAVIEIKRSKNTLRFLRINPESSFYSSLEKKLKGKQ